MKSAWWESCRSATSPFPTARAPPAVHCPASLSLAASIRSRSMMVGATARAQRLRQLQSGCPESRTVLPAASGMVRLDERDLPQRTERCPSPSRRATGVRRVGSDQQRGLPRRSACSTHQVGLARLLDIRPPGSTVRVAGTVTPQGSNVGGVELNGGGISEETSTMQKHVLMLTASTFILACGAIA